MVMKDALDGTVLTSLDLKDMERRYGTPYMVIHRSDLHGLFLKACQNAGVDLRTGQHVTGYENTPTAARASGSPTARRHPALLVIAADGLHSVARGQLVGDEPVNSAYVAYRGAVPMEQARENNISESDVVVYVGPRCHFVQYPLRGGDMFNQVAVFESAKARAGEEDWGTPDELDAAFAPATGNVRKGLPLMRRDRCWRMFDRDPIMTWVYGRIALLGDAAHPPLQYIAQGAIMAIEDGYVLAEHLAGNPDGLGQCRYGQCRYRPCPGRLPGRSPGALPPRGHRVPRLGHPVAPGRRKARTPQRDSPRQGSPRLQLCRLALQHHRPHAGRRTANVPDNPPRCGQPRSFTGGVLGAL